MEVAVWAAARGKNGKRREIRSAARTWGLLQQPPRGELVEELIPRPYPPVIIAFVEYEANSEVEQEDSP